MPLRNSLISPLVASTVREAVSGNMALGLRYSTFTLHVPLTSSSFAEVMSKSSAPTATFTWSATRFFRSSKVSVGRLPAPVRESGIVHIRLSGCRLFLGDLAAVSGAEPAIAVHFAANSSRFTL